MNFPCANSCPTDWRNNSDHAYSYPRGWRPSVIMCAQFRTLPETPRTIIALSILWGCHGRPSIVEAPIMPRERD